MILRIVLAFILFSLSAKAATLTLDGASVAPEGGKFRRYFGGGITNSTATYNLATNGVITSSNAVAITVHTPAIVNGSSNYLERTIVATDILRWAYPYNTNQGAVQNGAEVIVWDALSDYIYAGDTIINYTNGANSYSNHAAASFVATNNSLLTFPYPKGNWMTTGLSRETGAVMYVELFAEHRSAQQFRPVRQVKFIATGVTSGHRYTNIQTEMKIDEDVYGLSSVHLGDALPSARYIGEITTSGFNDLELVTVDFEIEGWWGTNWTTQWNWYSMPTPLPARLTNYFDRNNVFNKFAVVNIGGNNASGSVTSGVAPSSVPLAGCFTNIALAWNALQATNNNFTGIAQAIGMIYVVNGITNYPGGAVSLNRGSSWTIIQGFPGNEPTITTSLGGGSSAHNEAVKFKNMTISLASGTLVSGCDYVAMEDVTMNSDTTGLLQNCPVVYWQRGSIPRLGQGLRSFTTQNTTMALVRGVDLEGFTGTITPWSMVGCQKLTNAGTCTIDTGISGSTGPAPDFQFIYNCRINLSSVQSGNIGSIYNYTYGTTLANSLFEVSTASSSFSMCASSSLYHTNNGRVHCTFAGPRNQVDYNETGTIGAFKEQNYQKNCVFAYVGYHGNDFSGTPNANRTNNWLSSQWQVASSGNIVLNTTNVVVGSGGDPEFIGLNSWRLSSNTNTSPSFPEYMVMADISVTNSIGGGNYEPRYGSPLSDSSLVANTLREQIFPYDLNRKRRTAFNNAAGAYITRPYTVISPIGTTTISPIGTTTISK